MNRRGMCHHCGLSTVQCVAYRLIAFALIVGGVLGIDALAKWCAL